MVLKELILFSKEWKIELKAKYSEAISMSTANHRILLLRKINFNESKNLTVTTKVPAGLETNIKLQIHQFILTKKENGRHKIKWFHRKSKYYKD